MNVYIGGRHGMQRPMVAISFRVCAFAFEIRGHAACAARCRLPAANSGTTTYCGARSRWEPRRAPAARGSSGKASVIAALDGILTFILIIRYRQTDGVRLRRVSKESGAKRVHKQRAGWAEDAAVTNTRSAQDWWPSVGVMLACRRVGFLAPSAAKAPHGRLTFEGLRFLKTGRLWKTPSAVTRSRPEVSCAI